jgi:hypothetical protein
MTLLLTVALSFLVISLAIAAMSVGVMAGRRPIRGSCGGLNGAGCALCSGRCRKREDGDAGDAR